MGEEGHIYTQERDSISFHLFLIQYKPITQKGITAELITQKKDNCGVDLISITV
jgi:hypothetical protein